MAVAGVNGRVKVLGSGELIDVALPPEPSFWSRWGQAAVPDPPPMGPVWEVFSWR